MRGALGCSPRAWLCSANRAGCPAPRAARQGKGAGQGSVRGARVARPGACIFLQVFRSLTATLPVAASRRLAGPGALQARKFRMKD
jgi:hypothetical protein